MPPWLYWTVLGLVAGTLAKFLVPGRDPSGCIITVVLGIAGALIGYWLWGALGGSDTRGIDWIRWVISIAAAALLSFLYTGLTRRSRTRA